MEKTVSVVLSSEELRRLQLFAERRWTQNRRSDVVADRLWKKIWKATIRSETKTVIEQTELPEPV